uniref:RNA-directed DNA polymerase, eukaryota n=1 Tax=Tanacetum cinerariifolium TaxID=118510 RepID=A0A699GQU5_TANCI|nr:RNA-directed DNA polymerase, eukaryota [Tanacetum cinerariifolium]
MDKTPDSPAMKWVGKSALHHRGVDSPDSPAMKWVGKSPLHHSGVDSPPRSASIENPSHTARVFEAISYDLKRGLIEDNLKKLKSKIMGVLVDSDKVKCPASKLGCLILKTSFSYLGSKVGGSMSRVHTWNEVVDRVKNRLSKWKMKTLSIGGRVPRGGVEQEQFDELSALVHDITITRWIWALESS